MSYRIEATQNLILWLERTGIDDDKSLSLETQYLLNMVSMLKEMKSKMTPEFIAELKAMDV